MKLPALILLATSQLLIFSASAAPKDKAQADPPCAALKAEVAKAERELEKLRKQSATLLAELNRAKRTRHARHAPKPDAKLQAANRKLAEQVVALQREQAELLSIHERLRNQAAAAKKIQQRHEAQFAELANRLTAEKRQGAKQPPRPLPNRPLPNRPQPPASSPAAQAVAVLHFDKNDCTPTHEKEAAIAKIKEILRNNKDAQFDLIGHASSTGCAQANLCLSDCRAAAVRDLLIIAGIAPRILDTYALGDTKPVANNASPKGRAKNRRVEVHLYQPGSLPPGH